MGVVNGVVRFAAGKRCVPWYLIKGKVGIKDGCQLRRIFGTRHNGLGDYRLSVWTNDTVRVEEYLPVLVTRL